MNANDKINFTKMISMVGEYYGRDVTDSLITLYWSGLQQYDIGAIRDAMNRHVQNPDSGQFMPKIADIVKMIGGTSQDAALLAWAKVDRAVRTVGTYSDVVFDDPLIHKVIVDMGGWIKLGERKEDEWPFVAKEFGNRYRGLRNHADQISFPAVLIGMANASNALHGFRPEAVRMIGNPEACQKVLRLGTSDRRIPTSMAAIAAELHSEDVSA
jgi:hypothetical protein